jgi:small-conductance mechanosensitive channel
MVKVIALALFLIFLFLSLIHFYWAFGGKWGTEGVYPTPDDKTPPRNPGIIATILVAVALFAFGVFYLMKVEILSIEFSPGINKYGLWVLMILFILRAIGDFKYLGFFKKIKNTKFGQNDTKYFAPLCLIIGILTLLVAVLT